MNGFLKNPLKKTEKCLEAEGSINRRRSEQDSTKLMLQKNLIIPTQALNICYPLLLFVIFLEPTFFCFHYLFFLNKYKLYLTITGYFIFLYIFLLYFFIRNKSQPVKKNEKYLFFVGLFISILISLIDAYLSESFSLIALLPLISLKLTFLIYVPKSYGLIAFTIIILAVHSILFSFLQSRKLNVLEYLQIAFFILISILMPCMTKEKSEMELTGEKESPKQDHAFRLGGIDKIFDLLEDCVVLVESGSLVYSNQAFKKMFRESSNGMSSSSRDSLDEKETSFANKFVRVKNLKPERMSLENQLKDLIKGSNSCIISIDIKQDHNISGGFSRNMDSPECFLTREKETNLLNIYIHFINYESTLKKKGIGFNPVTQLPVFEHFTGTLDKIPIRFSLGYLEIFKRNYFCLLFQNNPHQKEIEELKAELEACKKIPPYLAHEMRNPLGAVQSFLEAVQEDPGLSEELRLKYVIPTSNMIQYLLALVNDLLDAGQIAAEKFKVVVGPTNISGIIDRVMSMFEIKARAKMINLGKEIDSRLPQEILTDSARLSQIMINLVSNALKYTPKNGYITIKAEHNVLNARRVDFCIEDTGLGIKPGDQKVLLSDWTKVEDKVNSKLNPFGVGLGLSISNKLARQLSFDTLQEGLKIESVFGKGTKIRFSIENKKNEKFVRTPNQVLTICQGQKVDSNENYSSFLEENQASLDLSNKIKAYSEIGLRKVKKTMTVMRNPSSESLRRQENYVCSCSKVLVIDDDYFSGNSLAIILKLMKIEVDVVQNTEDALEKLHKKFLDPESHCKEYKIIFMDAIMEGMDGFESTILLRQEMKQKRIGKAPIVFCTALDGTQEEKAKSLGASFFVTKPISKEKLKKILKEASFEFEVKSP